MGGCRGQKVHLVCGHWVEEQGEVEGDDGCISHCREQHQICNTSNKQQGTNHAASTGAQVSALLARAPAQAKQQHGCDERKCAFCTWMATCPCLASSRSTFRGFTQLAGTLVASWLKTHHPDAAQGSSHLSRATCHEAAQTHLAVLVLQTWRGSRLRSAVPTGWWRSGSCGLGAPSKPAHMNSLD